MTQTKQERLAAKKVKLERRQQAKDVYRALMRALRPNRADGPSHQARKKAERAVLRAAHAEGKDDG